MQKEVEMNPAYPMSFALACVVIAGAFDFPAALSTAANAQQYPDLTLDLRCPKHDSKGVALAYEVAHRGDSNLEWTITCSYREVK